MKKAVIISLIFLLSDCNGHEERWKKETIGTVHFEVPANWKKTAANGTDSKVMAFVTPSSDTLYCEYGFYNNSFDESKIIVSDSIIYNALKENSLEKNIAFSNNKELDNSQGIFLDNYYYYETISNHKAKVMLPKKSEKGQMGLYLENIDKKQNNFSIYTAHPLKGIDSLHFYKLKKSIQIE